MHSTMHGLFSPFPLLLLVVVVAVRAANRYTLTSPTSASVWISGQPVTLSWTYDTTDTIAHTSTIRLDLCLTRHGIFVTDHVVATIAGVLPADAGSIGWTAPAVNEASGEFYVRLERNKNKSGIGALFESRDRVESPRFRIEPANASANPPASGRRKLLWMRVNDVSG